MKIKTYLLALLTTSQIAACSSNDISNENVCFTDRGEIIDCSLLSMKSNNFGSELNVPLTQDLSLFSNNINFQLLSEYIEVMSMDLMNSIDSSSIKGPIAVTSFVNLNSTLKTTSLLGNHISEYFINELRNTNFPVTDFKVTGFIQVTPDGDLAMSRKIFELKDNLEVAYILTGTLIQNERGVIVNARIVSLSTNTILSSTTKLLPHIVLSGLVI